MRTQVQVCLKQLSNVSLGFIQGATPKIIFIATENHSTCIECIFCIYLFTISLAVYFGQYGAIHLTSQSASY